MTRSIMRVANVVAALFLAAGRAEAQQTMSVTGHVTYRGAPVSGALVRFPQLGIERLTTADGRYSFLIPQASVRGQTATLTVRVDDRRIAYRPMSVELGLTGGKLVQDFALALAEFPRAGAQRRDSTGSSLFDPLELPALSGSVSLPAALAGRVPGLDIRVSAVQGGTDRLQHRGPRTLVGSNQPLIVIDGLPVIFFVHPARFRSLPLSRNSGVLKRRLLA